MEVLEYGKRTLLPRRHWVRGQLLDILSRKTVLHVDAYVRALKRAPWVNVLDVAYSVGGKRDVARDVYVIDPNACTLTPVQGETFGHLVMWCAENAALMQRVHLAVLDLAERSKGACGTSAVSLFCHYVPAPDTDVFKGIKNEYQAQTRRSPANRTAGTLPDLL